MFPQVVMTNNNIKIASLFGALMVAVILPFSGINFAIAENAPIETKPSTPEPREGSEVLPLSEFDGVPPKVIPESRSLDQQKIAASDSRVSELLGNNYEHHSTAQYFEDGVWEPVVSFYADDQKNIVTAKLKQGKVVSVEKYETHKWTHANKGFAVDQYTDDTYTVQGLSMNMNVPAYSHSAGSWTALLVNAVKDGTTANVCISSNMPGSYWGQVGMEFSTNGVRVGYADTGTNCDPAFLPMPFSTGDDLTFRVYVDDANDDWYMFMDNNSDNPSPPYAFVRSVANSDYVDTDNPNSNVFFENPNASTVNWDPGFTAGDITVDWASFQWTDDNWYLWEDEFLDTVGCHPGATTAQLMSGSFVTSPHDLTFDVSNMDSLCGQS